MRAELRYSLRSFARTPGVTLALLATIALGVGSNAAVFGFIRGLVTAGERPAAVIDRTVAIFRSDPQYGYGPVALDSIAALVQRRDVFEQIGAARETQIRANVDGRLLTAPAAFVTPDLASLLQLDLDDGVVVSARAWEDEFLAHGADAGARIRIRDVDHQVAGVAPEWLDGIFIGQQIDLWLPLDAVALAPAERSQPVFWALGRLREGVSADAARAAVEAVAGDDALAVVPYTGAGPETSTGLSRLATLLPAAAALVFFIACGNVVTLLLSRAAARAQESSVRVALGAGRRDLVRALVADSLVIAIAGGAGGALLAMWTMDVLPAMFFIEDAEQLRFGATPAHVAAVAAAGAAIVTACGLAPLIDLRHDRPAAVLRRESAGPSAAVRRLRTGLVVAQIAVCSVLAVSTGLLFGGLRAALQTPAGEQLGAPIVVNLAWRNGRDDIQLGREYYERAEKALFALPATTSVAWTATLPGGRPASETMQIEPADLPWRDVELDVASFTLETVDRIQRPVLDGRLFSGADVPGGCVVGVINEPAAQLLFGKQSAAGRILIDSTKSPVEIVGVVREREPAPPPRIYFYAPQGPPPAGAGAKRFLAPVLPGDLPEATFDVNLVSPNYFDAMAFPAVAGVVWTNSPPRSRCLTAVVNQEASSLYFAGRAVGAAVVSESGSRAAIIGVVRTPPLRAAQRPVAPTIFFATSQMFHPQMKLILGARDASEETLASVRRALDLDDRSPVVMPLEAHLARTGLATERIASVLFGAAAALALSLAALGIYGAMADAVGRRRREFALRIALGAQRWRVIRQVIAEGLRLAGAGVLAGLIGSLVAAWWLAGVMPASGSLDVVTTLAGPVAVGVLVLAASVVPARRALASNPLAIMRE